MLWLGTRETNKASRGATAPRDPPSETVAEATPGRPQPRPGKHRGHLPVSLKQTQKMQITGSDGREAGGAWDGGAGGTAGPGDTRKVMAVSPVPRALVVPPASTGVNLPDQARQPQAGHAR